MTVKEYRDGNRRFYEYKIAETEAPASSMGGQPAEPTGQPSDAGANDGSVPANQDNSNPFSLADPGYIDFGQQMRSPSGADAKVRRQARMLTRLRQ